MCFRFCFSFFFFLLCFVYGQQPMVAPEAASCHSPNLHPVANVSFLSHTASFSHSFQGFKRYTLASRSVLTHPSFPPLVSSTTALKASRPLLAALITLIPLSHGRHGCNCWNCQQNSCTVLLPAIFF